MGSLPLNWSQWSSDPNTSFAVTSSPTLALSGSKSFSVTGGTSQAVTRTWLDTTMPADVQVSAAVYVSSLIPAQVIARGSNLNTADGPNGPSFYALQLSRGIGQSVPLLELIEDVNGTQAILGSITASTYMQDVWLRETLDVEGGTERAQLFDPTTNEYLNSSGQWQIGQTWALTALDTKVSGSGFVGLGRPASYAGTATFDDFSVLTPAADQTFDSTPVGSLPDNWSQWSSNGSNNFFAVASPSNPTPISGPNVMTVTPLQSNQTARAWLNTSLPADLTASADVYLNALTPAQVFARGSDLNSATPTYYAVEVSRGMTVKLVKVVNGVETDLGSTTSSGYLDNTWVQETLVLSGSTLEAQVYSPELNEYLNSSGNWQSAQAWAVSASDTSISGGGQAGLARPVVKEYVETNYFDDFTTAVGVDAQDFDAATGSLPTGMKQWSSDNNDNYFTVAAAPDNNHFLSANNVLETKRINSGVTAQAYDTSESLTNAQVSMGLYVYSSMPDVQVIARGTNLGSSSTAPSYYGLSITEVGDSGLTINLERVNGGAVTQTWQLQSPYYFNQWIQETLYVDGDNVRASVYRADTGQYLNSDGQWQTLPTYAINTIDTSSQALTGAGYGGIVLATSSPNTGYLDNFAVVPLTVDSTPPTVTVSAPSGTLSGTVTVTATPTETVQNYSISKVEFYVDGVLNWVDTASPYTWDFDTKSVSNGTHTLLVMAYDNEGNIGTASTSVVTSNNTTLTMPSNFTQHQNDIGITELDYGGGDYDNTLLQKYVDVVVSVPGDLQAIHNVDSSDQQLIYTNVSNIYSSQNSHSSTDSLLNWLSYAETNDIDPEQAFYHVSVATPFSYSDGSHSVQPVDWFWGVYAYQNSSWRDLTSAAEGSGGVPFGNGVSVVGDTMNVGYTDKFAEIDINLSTKGSGGAYVLEYPSALDSNGNPTTWSTLTASDGTNGLTTSGTITFDPPSNCVPAVVDGSGNNSPRYYYVRFRTTTAFSTIPVASTVLGVNYTQSSDNGSTTTGIIPAYDWALDPQGTYLDSQQYAIAVAAGYDARFAYQSRFFYDGQMRFATNPSNPNFKAWALGYYPNILSGYQDANGYFVDNSTGNLPWEGSKEGYAINEGGNEYYKIDLVEPTDSYSNDYATLLNEIGLDIAPHNQWIMANTGGSYNVPGGQTGQTYADPVISKLQGYYEEFGLSALADDTTDYLSLYSKVYNRVTNDNPSNPSSTVTVFPWRVYYSADA